MTHHDEYQPPKHDPPAPKHEPKGHEKEPSAWPEGYEPAPFPKMKFDKHGKSRTVQNELDEDTAAGDGFDLDKPPAPKDDDEDEDKKKKD